MSAISGNIVLIDHMLFRSLLPRNQQIRVPGSNRRRLPRFEVTALQLASHFLMTTFLFLALAIAVWIASWGFQSLQSVHQFPDELFHVLDRLEVWFVYADAALICCTLFFGCLQYIWDVLRGHP